MEKSSPRKFRMESETPTPRKRGMAMTITVLDQPRLRRRGAYHYERFGAGEYIARDERCGQTLRLAPK